MMVNVTTTTPSAMFYSPDVYPARHTPYVLWETFSKDGVRYSRHEGVSAETLLSSTMGGGAGDVELFRGWSGYWYKRYFTDLLMPLIVAVKPLSQLNQTQSEMLWVSTDLLNLALPKSYVKILLQKVIGENLEKAWWVPPSLMQQLLFDPDMVPYHIQEAVLKNLIETTPEEDFYGGHGEEDDEEEEEDDGAF